MAAEKCENIDMEKIEAGFSGCYAAMLTDEYRIGHWPIQDGFDIAAKEGSLLELRIFNENAEYKWTRGNVGESFVFRKLDDQDKTVKKRYDKFDEVQLLDVDFSKERSYRLPGTVNTPKGADFYLPISGEISKEQVPFVKVKYYVPKFDKDDDSTVHAYVKDWRLAGFGICSKAKEESDGEILRK